MPSYFYHKKTQPISFDYKLNNISLSKSSNFDYLGISFNNKLSWSDHIRSICSKALRTIYFLNRNLQGASQDLKLKAYVSYVRPIIEYATCVWNPSSVESTQLLDSVQRLAIRFIRNNFSRYRSVTEMSIGLELPALSVRRNVNDLTTVFKIFNKEIFIDPNVLFSLNSFSSTRGHSLKLYKPNCTVNSFRDSFSYRIIDQWNKLDPSLISCPDSHSFKSNLINQL